MVSYCLFLRITFKEDGQGSKSFFCSLYSCLVKCRYPGRDGKESDDPRKCRIGVTNNGHVVKNSSMHMPVHRQQEECGWSQEISIGGRQHKKNIREGGKSLTTWLAKGKGPMFPGQVQPSVQIGVCSDATLHSNNVYNHVYFFFPMTK